MNNVILIGRIGKDIELRQSTTGKAVTNFSLAVRKPMSSNGDDECDWFNIVAWGKTAEAIAKCCTKGSLIGIHGNLSTRNFPDKQTGKMVYIVEVIAQQVEFLEPKKTNQNQGQYQQQTPKNVGTPSYANNDVQVPPISPESTTFEVNDDDLPF